MRIVNGDAVPPHIAFIDPKRDVKVLGRDVTAADTSVRRAGRPRHQRLEPAWADGRRRAPLDGPQNRHRSSREPGRSWRRRCSRMTTSESTGRLVLQAIDALGVELTPEMAMPLFAAIATDTGWFRFASVTEATLSAAARLVAAGAKPHAVFAALYEQNSLARLLLQGRILIEREIASRRPAAVDRDHAGRFTRSRRRTDRYGGRHQPAARRGGRRGGAAVPGARTAGNESQLAEPFGRSMSARSPSNSAAADTARPPACAFPARSPRRSRRC